MTDGGRLGAMGTEGGAIRAPSDVEAMVSTPTCTVHLSFCDWRMLISFMCTLYTLVGRKRAS